MKEFGYELATNADPAANEESIPNAVGSGNQCTSSCKFQQTRAVPWSERLISTINFPEAVQLR